MALDVPSRFPKGVTNNLASHPLGRFKNPDPLRAHIFANDFDAYASGDWSLTGQGTPTSALTAGDGGLLLLTTTTAAGDGAFLQKTPGAFTMQSGKQIWFRGLFTLADVTATTFFAGIVNAGATAFAPTDGFYFTKAAAGTQLVFNYKNTTGSVSQSFNLPNTPATYTTYNDLLQSSGTASFLPIANSTQFVLGAHYDGNVTLQIFFNDARVGSITLAGAPTTATLAPAFGVTNGTTTAAKTLTVDGVLAAKERY